MRVLFVTQTAWNGGAYWKLNAPGDPSHDACFGFTRREVEACLRAYREFRRNFKPGMPVFEFDYEGAA